jgi:hypothetical protein
MSFFSVNHNEAQSGVFEPVTPGNYEVVISEVKKETFNSGNKGLKLTFTIREDVDQLHGKRKIFNNLVAMETAMFNWNNIAKATNMPDGQAFETADDVINAFGKHLQGKTLKIRVAHREYNGKTYEDVKGYSESEAAGTTLTGDSNPFSVPNGAPPLPGDGDAPTQAEMDQYKAPWEQ